MNFFSKKIPKSFKVKWAISNGKAPIGKSCEEIRVLATHSDGTWRFLVNTMTSSAYDYDFESYEQAKEQIERLTTEHCYSDLDETYTIVKCRVGISVISEMKDPDGKASRE